MNSIPEELKVNARWVCCTADKRPICPATGAPASSTDPATWASYAAAVQAVPRLGCRGIGYVLGDFSQTVLLPSGCFYAAQPALWQGRCVPKQRHSKGARPLCGPTPRHPAKAHTFYSLSFCPCVPGFFNIPPRPNPAGYFIAERR